MSSDARLTREQFLSQLERAVPALEGLPVSQGLVRHLAASLSNGEPAWWKAARKAWARRSFGAWTEAWSLFLAAVHYDALGDPKCPLRAYFPSCGGTAEADPAPAFARYLEELPEAMLERLSAGQTRPYVPARATLWLPAAASCFQRRGLPYYVVEVNAGGGLNLAADVLQPRRGFDADLVAARIGLDPAPLDVELPDARRWLAATHLPEEVSELKKLGDAMETVRQRQRSEPNFIQLVPCLTELAPAFMAKNIPADEPDVGLLVFNMGATVRMSDDDYKAFHADMAEALKPWGGRGLWLEVEKQRGDPFSTKYQAVLHKPSPAGFDDFVMLRFDVAARKLELELDADAAHRFLTARR